MGHEEGESQILSHLYIKSNLGMQLQTPFNYKGVGASKIISSFFPFLFLSLTIWISCVLN